MESDLKYWVAFSLIPNLGAVRFRALESHFGNLKTAWQAGFDELKAAGLDEKTARSITTHRGAISPDEQMEKLERCGAHVINWNDPEYPARLKEIHSPPPVLYIREQLSVEDERSVAVVGTGKASSYGKEVASVRSALPGVAQ